MIPYKPASRLPLPNPSVVDPADPESLRTHLVGLNAVLLDLTTNVQVKTSAADQILIQSPNGSVYAITVTDLGALQVVARNVV